jgi:hypothetical protein
MLAGLANANGESNRHHDDEVATRLPIKRCTVYVSTMLLLSSQPVSVLSAALSSRGRISRDKDDAGRISGTPGPNYIRSTMRTYRCIDHVPQARASVLVLQWMHLSMLLFSHPAGTIQLG